MPEPLPSFAVEPVGLPSGLAVGPTGGAGYVRSIRSMRTTQEIVESIDKRLRELDDEIKRLDAARAAVDGHQSRPPASATNRRNRAASARSRTKTSAQSRRETSAEVSAESAPRSRKRARATSRGRGVAKGASKPLPADRLESLLSENGGVTTSALAEKTGGSPDHVLMLLRELEAAGRVRRTGQRRGTRWQTITDEDRIRERAAELEATRKRPA